MFRYTEKCYYLTIMQSKKKIGRNDPCPCGSGKKFKRCCGRETQQSSTITIPWPTFPEEMVISEILASSREYQAFYSAERKKITKEVYWARDSSLPKGIDYRSTRLGIGKEFLQVIRLRRIPAIAEDAIDIAHELGHFILDNEGYPSTGCPISKYENLSSSLNSMVHDPLVDSRLQVYGFDLWSKYQKEMKETLSQLGKQLNSPSDKFARLRWTFNYVSKMLDWELVSSKPGQFKNEFPVWFEDRYPDIAEEGHKLLTMIRETGYDTPVKLTTLFQKIIRANNLGTIFFLRTFT